jgi:hypothetical protein
LLFHLFFKRTLKACHIGQRTTNLVMRSDLASVSMDNVDLIVADSYPAFPKFPKKAAVNRPPLW